MKTEKNIFIKNCSIHFLLLFCGCQFKLYVHLSPLVLKMKSRVIGLFVVVLFVSMNSIAQVGIGTTTPNPHSILDLNSSTMGFLPSRMTTTEKTTLGVSLGAADKGMLVFDTSLIAYYYWNGVQWLLLRIDSVVTDFEATGNLYLTAETNTTLVADTPKKIEGSTLGTNLVNFSTSGNNRLVYQGDIERVFTVICSLSFDGDTNNDLFSFYIAKGSPSVTTAILTETRVYRFLASTPDIGALSISGTVSLANGEWIEVWTEANKNSDLIAKTLNLLIE